MKTSQQDINGFTLMQNNRFVANNQQSTLTDTIMKYELRWSKT